MNGGYLVQVDHAIYEPKGGGSFTLGDAWRAIQHVGNAAVRRDDAELTLVYERRGISGTPVLSRRSA